MSDERERFEKAAGPYRREFWHPWACWQAAIQAERERCAKIAESCTLDFAGEQIADAIRRGEEV